MDDQTQQDQVAQPTAPADGESIEEKNKRLEKTAQLLLRRDLDLRKINDELEKEKIAISGEKNKLQVILSAIKDGIIAVDLKAQIASFNKAAEELTGYKADEVIGKNISLVLKVFDKSKEIEPKEYSPIADDGFEGVVYSKEELTIIGANNKEFSASLVAAQIEEARFIDLGCILTLHDTSQEKELEKMKLDFVSMAAHELRTPLTSIKSYLSVLMEENQEKFSDEQKMFLNTIQSSTEKILVLIESLLSVSGIEKGTFEIHPSLSDWIPIVEQVLLDFQSQAKQKDIELSFVKPQEQLPQINIDKIRLSEVLSNLLANAVSYTQNGGKIMIWIEKNENEVITHIKDTGKGIPQEAISHLFTKFFRVTSSLTQGAKGTGLGLYISKAIIDKHNGKIWAESEVRKGSTFSFSLPILTTQNL